MFLDIFHIVEISVIEYPLTLYFIALSFSLIFIEQLYNKTPLSGHFISISLLP